MMYERHTFISLLAYYEGSFISATLVKQNKGYLNNGSTRAALISSREDLGLNKLIKHAGGTYISMQGEYIFPLHINTHSPAYLISMVYAHGNRPEQVYTQSGTFEYDPAPKMIFHRNTILHIMGPCNSPCGLNYKELRMLKKQITVFRTGGI
jgi:hypothetical protein